MQNKKLASIIALTAVVANLGVASMAFAQESATGTQPINCAAENTQFALRVPAPADFAFAARQVSNNYDTTVSDSYFGGDTGDLVDSVAVTSNTPVACASETRSVQLDVQAESPFYTDEDNSLDFNAGDRVLSNVGTDETFETSDDIAAILSISHDAVTCDSGSPQSCTSANATVNYGAAKDGSNNYFTTAGSTGALYTAGAALLTPADNYDKALTNSLAPTPLTIFSSLQGYDGEVTVQNISFKIALPANIEINGTSATYTTNVLYTIS